MVIPAHMPLSKNKNCRYCASLAHKSDQCHRVDKSNAPAKAATRAAAKEARSAASRAKFAAINAAKEAAKLKAEMKRAARRAAVIAHRARVTHVQAVHAALHAALVEVGVAIQTTPANYSHSNWAMVSDLCHSCSFPPGRCMCI